MARVTYQMIEDTLERINDWLCVRGVPLHIKNIDGVHQIQDWDGEVLWEGTKKAEILAWLLGFLQGFTHGE